jgi:hypothetical protein
MTKMGNTIRLIGCDLTKDSLIDLIRCRCTLIWFLARKVLYFAVKQCERLSIPKTDDNSCTTKKIPRLGAVYTCDFPYESPYDSVYDLLPKVSGKIIFDFFC